MDTNEPLQKCTSNLECIPSGGCVLCFLLPAFLFHRAIRLFGILSNNVLFLNIHVGHHLPFGQF